MRFKVFKNTVLLFVLIVISCGSNTKNNKTSDNEILKRDQNDTTKVSTKSIIVGANQTENYIPLLKGKRVGIVANQTSVIFQNKRDSIYEVDPETGDYLLYKTLNSSTHLVDSLLSLSIEVKKVFAPEHGFRGTADAGEIIKDGLDTKTGLPIISLYGNNKKPTEAQLKNIDIVVFDIQDVGARFYTYISSLHYVMEACAEQNIPVLILDRPNPNGHYIDGPILEPEHRSFVGMHPVPVVHGMTIAEYAKMINGESWLENKIKCELEIIPVKNYSHKKAYSLPIKPSPNLPNDQAINLYPSLCFFEGTNVSIGRGTDKQFQVIGTPFFNIESFNFEFVPKPNDGAKYPKHQGNTCHGYDLSDHKKLDGLNISWLKEFYKANKNYAENETFFTDFFTKLAGTENLRKQIEAGLSEKEIKQNWQTGLKEYQQMRKQYLMYD